MSIQLQGYKHIIWDWNGTLLNDVWLCMEILNRMLKKRGLPEVDIDAYQRVFDFPIINYYKNVGFDFSKESFEEIAHDFVQEYTKRCYECTLHDNVEEILNKIMDMGISQSILSASHQEVLDNFVDYYGIGEYFINVLGLDNHYAPSKIDNGKLWIKKLGLCGCDVLLVGDTVHDYEVSQAINTDCLLISWGHHSVDKLQKCGVNVVDNLSTLGISTDLCRTTYGY